MTRRLTAVALVAGVALGTAGTLRAGDEPLFDRCGWRFPEGSPPAARSEPAPPAKSPEPAPPKTVEPARVEPARVEPAPAKPSPAPARPSPAAAKPAPEDTDLFDRTGPTVRPLRAWTGAGRPEE